MHNNHQNHHQTQCAASALEVSRGLREIDVDDREFDELMRPVEKLDSQGGS